MIEELDRIVEHLHAMGRHTPELLQQGLTIEELRAWEARLPFSLPSEVEQIYAWRNGTKAEEGDLLDALHFFPGFYFLSIEEAVQTFSERHEAPQWRKGWFPVFANGAGDFYLACCKKKKTDTAEIVGFLQGEPEQIVEYESLTAMVQTLEACFAEQAFFVDEDNTLEIDDERHREIAHRFNPEIEEWQG